MKKYSIPKLEILNFTVEDSIMDIISASGNKEGSVGELIGIGDFLDF